MGFSGAYFDGRLYFRPGARGKFKSKELRRGASLDLNTLILIGTSTNGFNCNDPTLPQRKRVMEFVNFQEAREILGGGELLDAVKGAFNPSKDQRFAIGPTLIKVLNIADNEQAEIAKDGHTIKALIPGPNGNKIRFRVISPTEIIITDGVETYKQSNLVQDDLAIQYTGDATTATIAINSTNITVTLAGDQTDGSLGFDLLLEDYPVLFDIAEKIASLTGYTVLIKSKPDFLTADLDHITGQDIMIPANIKGTFHRQKTFLQSTGLIEIENTTNTPFTADAVYIYLVNGSTGIWTNTDYIDAIEFSKNVSGLYRNVCTNNIAVAQALSECLNFMNSPDGSSETFGGAGCSRVLFFEDRLDLAKSINNEYMVYGISPVNVYGFDGVTEKTFDGWYLAILHNACKAATNPREAISQKALNIIDSPEILSHGQAIKAIQTGVLHTKQDDSTKSWMIEFALTTYQKSDRILTQASYVCTALAMSKDFRESLQVYTSEIVDDADLRVFADSKLKEYEVKFGYITKNIYTGEPAADLNYTIERDGDIVYFIFPDVKLTSPINFFFHIFNLSLPKGTSTGA